MKDNEFVMWNKKRKWCRMRASGVEAPDESYPLNGASMTPSNAIIPVGLCQCGCGKPTKISTKTRRTRGEMKGQPQKYLVSHNRRIVARVYPSVDEGCEYRLIPLTQGQFAKVSAHRFDNLNQFMWSARWAPNTKTFYAFRWGGAGNKAILMHRVILGLSDNDSLSGEHKNGDTLDNTDENLRIATSSQNHGNRKRPKQNKSGYKGVSWSKSAKKWIAQIGSGVGGRPICLGVFDSAEDAHRAYREAAILRYGEFARFG